MTFLEEEKVVELPAGGSSGRQLVPGLLLMADSTTGSYVHTPVKNSGQYLPVQYLMFVTHALE